MSSASARDQSERIQVRLLSVLQRSKPTSNGLAADLRLVSRLIRTGCPGLCAAPGATPPALAAALPFMANLAMRALPRNPLVDFLSVNLDVPWRIDSDTNLSAFHAENGHRDVWTDSDGFADTASENEH